MKTYKQTPAPKHTPWGQADDVSEVAPGWWSVGTPSHGGFILSAERVADLPQLHIERSFNGQGARGIFEEDCDWVIPVLAFQDEYQLYCRRTYQSDTSFYKQLAIAQDILNNWILKKEVAA